MIQKNYSSAQLRAIEVACRVARLKVDLITGIESKTDRYALLNVNLLWSDFTKLDCDPRVSEKFKDGIDWGACRTFLAKLKQEIKEQGVRS